MSRDKNNLYVNENVNNDKKHNKSENSTAIVKSDHTKHDINLFENPLPIDDTYVIKIEHGGK